jgi:Uma2 family endonuclease
MASVPKYYLSPDEYLALERAAEFKSEYMDGVVYALAGASKRLNLIAANLIITLGGQLKGRPCTVYPSDLKVRVPNSKGFFYPDVSVVCWRGIPDKVMIPGYIPRLRVWRAAFACGALNASWL